MTQSSPSSDLPSRYLAFEGHVRLAAGSLEAAAIAAKQAHERGATAPVLVFDGQTGRVVDLDLRGSNAEVAARLIAPPAARGRPKLGVTAREVTLLPRHWDWLASQPGGASATLRRLVEAARKAGGGEAARDAAYRLMSALAGDLPGFEEASRALFAGDMAKLRDCIRQWPQDVGEEVIRLADPSPAAA